MKNALAAVIALLALGCGGSMAMRSVDVAAYQALLSNASRAVAAHEAASSSMTPATCPAERDRYAAEIRPVLQGMSSMSVDMDACMRDMGRGSEADMQENCRAMASELEDHLAVCCTATDVAAEAERHAAAMRAMLEREAGRASTMETMRHDAMMSGATCHG